MALKTPPSQHNDTSGSWNELPTDIECKVYLIPEQEGGFSVVAANLPGACSQGDTETEALENIREALQGLFESYRAANEEIPWGEVEAEANALTRMVTVHACHRSRARKRCEHFSELALPLIESQARITS